MLRNLWKYGMVWIVVFLFWAGPAGAEDVYVFGPDDAHITGSIQYSVVGRYQATFDRFSGLIFYDPRLRRISAVELRIEASSIHSRYPKLDKIVRSPQLLDTPRHDWIIFTGGDVQPLDDGFMVKGTLSLHGVTREEDFVFHFTPPSNDAGILEARGSWVINRKDFGIIWNRVLDHGGILVGNHITVDWEVRARKGDPAALFKDGKMPSRP